MKKIVLSSSLTLLALTSPVFGADDEEYFENPGLSAYIAEKAELPPPPKIDFPFPEGLYIGVTGGGGKINNIDIDNRSESLEFTRANRQKTLGQVGASVGYLFKEAGLFNQIEIQYMNRSKFVYKGVGPYGTIFDTSVKNQTGMAKLYSTLNIGHYIFPYVFVGVGAANNKAPASITLPFGAIIPLNTATAINAALSSPGSTPANNPKNKSSRTTAAGSAGVGARFRLAKQVMVDLNYEYTYLGKLRDWNLFSTSYNYPLVTFRGSKLWGHAVNFSFMIQPWGYASEAD